MADGLVSVLVPVYNGERFLPQLIDSLTAQTYGNFEAVFVDDISTDGSAGIIQNAARQDARIKYVRRTTKGKDAGTGIEYGLPHCTGDYYFYMSQDDFIDSDMLEKCVGKIKETNADIVLCNTCFYSQGAENKNFSRYPLNGDYAQELSPKEAFLLSLDWEIGGFGLRRMELVKKVGIVPTYFNSCEYYGICQLLLANKIAFCDSNFYYRSDNSEAITRKQNPHYYIEIFMQDVLLLEKMLEIDFSDRQKNDRLGEVARRVKLWHCYYRKNSFRYTAEQDRYYREILSDCVRRLANCSWQRRLAMNLLKIGLYQLMYLNPGAALYLKMRNRKKRARAQRDQENAYSVKTALARQLGCKVGRCTYCGEGVNVPDRRTTIGSFCSIAGNVNIGLNDHPTHYLSTSPFFYVETLGYRQGHQEIYSDPVEIGNDVWIGNGVSIKGGIKVGDGAVIGAGAVVTRDVPPYAIVAGVPAKTIRFRFDEKTIRELTELKWWDLDDAVIKTLPFKHPDKCIEELKKIRQGEKIG